jgi:monoamine oxidase
VARTPLAQSVEDAVAEIATGRTTRRAFVARAGLAGLGLTALGRFTPVARGAASPRIAIVGAGLAGLTAAHRLRQAGVSASVYEASSRLGGRCWTGRGAFAEGQIYEHGGELIDSGHLATKHLAQELGLDLDDSSRARPRERSPAGTSTAPGTPRQT